MAGKFKVAIVHDWLIGGGAERVTHELHKLFPDASIYTSYCSDDWRKRLDNKVVTGFLQHWPFSRLRKYLAILRIWWFTHLDFSGYDLVISVSGNGEAFGVKTPKETVHINYCHTPTHYYWRHYEKYLERPGFGLFDPLARLGLRLLVGPLRKWDYKAAQRADYFIANSTHIQRDIKKYYNRDSVVIHPPVLIERFERAPQPKERHGFLCGGRLVPMKRNDIAVEACTKLGLPLTVYGSGPDMERLKALAGPTITFTGFIDDESVAALFNSSEGFIFPSFEDFGVVGIEALAAGTPVIAYKAGGPLDYVKEGKTGVLFNEQSLNSLTKALKKFDPRDFDSRAIKKTAEQFSPEAFATKMQRFIDGKVKQ
jgi:glycosyltransferase involved in cell wall biosynthesis